MVSTKKKRELGELGELGELVNRTSHLEKSAAQRQWQKIVDRLATKGAEVAPVGAHDMRMMERDAEERRLKPIHPLTLDEP